MTNDYKIMFIKKNYKIWKKIDVYINIFVLFCMQIFFFKRKIIQILSNDNFFNKIQFEVLLVYIYIF